MTSQLWKQTIWQKLCLLMHWVCYKLCLVEHESCMVGHKSNWISYNQQLGVVTDCIRWDTNHLAQPRMTPQISYKWLGCHKYDYYAQLHVAVHALVHLQAIGMLHISAWLRNKIYHIHWKNSNGYFTHMLAYIHLICCLYVCIIRPIDSFITHGLSHQVPLYIFLYLPDKDGAHLLASTNIY